MKSWKRSSRALTAGYGWPYHTWWSFLWVTALTVRSLPGSHCISRDQISRSAWTSSAALWTALWFSCNQRWVACWCPWISGLLSHTVIEDFDILCWGCFLSSWVLRDFSDFLPSFPSKFSSCNPTSLCSIDTKPSFPHSTSQDFECRSPFWSLWLCKSAFHRLSASQ